MISGQKIFICIFLIFAAYQFKNSDLVVKTLDQQLYNASYRGDTGKMKLWLNLGANPNSQILHQGMTPLMAVAGGSGRLDAFQLLIDSGADVTLTSQKGFNVLNSLKISSIGIYEYLLDAGAQINQQPVINRIKGPTPLHSEILKDNHNNVEFLLERGADPCLVTGEEDHNALDIARERYSSKIKELLDKVSCY